MTDIEITEEMVRAGVKAAEDFIFSADYEIPAIIIPCLVEKIASAMAQDSQTVQFR